MVETRYVHKLKEEKNTKIFHWDIKSEKTLFVLDKNTIFFIFMKSQNKAHHFQKYTYTKFIFIKQKENSR